MRKDGSGGRGGGGVEWWWAGGGGEPDLRGVLWWFCSNGEVGADLFRVRPPGDVSGFEDSGEEMMNVKHAGIISCNVRQPAPNSSKVRRNSS